ncbi:MAG: AMP-binding protein [Planctomycetes bacterium]|nr:AMP-binding protein [Planctomycetota bacterium]
MTSRQTERLRVLLAAVIPANPFWTKKFGAHGVQPGDVRSLDDLARLPLTSKAEMVADHRDNPPYGSNLTFRPADYSRMHQTSGTTGRPLRWLDTPASWNWIMDCWAAIYRMIGLTRDDRLAFPASFGPFLGFWSAFDGAGRLGNLCLAGGGMSSRARLDLIQENRATVVCCTPTYALRLAEVADEAKIDLAAGSVQKLIVAGEPGGGIPATRKRIEASWGARVFDHWGMTELGSLAVECVENPGGLHILESECIAEILDPKTGQPTPAGTQGELVVTNLGRLGSPLIRYRTGDIVRVDTQPCPCGRELLRLRDGILGRTDEMVTIRGNNVFPTSLEAILREFDEIVEYRITLRTVRSMNELALEIEPTVEFEPANSGPDLTGRVASAVKDRLNFHVEVALVPCGQLPRFELKARRFVRES